MYSASSQSIGGKHADARSPDALAPQTWYHNVTVRLSMTERVGSITPEGVDDVCGGVLRLEDRLQVERVTYLRWYVLANEQ